MLNQSNFAVNYESTTMSTTLVGVVIALYFCFLFLIAYFTARGATSETFFNAQKSSPWYIVAFGMIGASLSGVTFISVPGAVGNQSFAYMQMVFGYLVGYFVIAKILLPLYYRLNLVSIYEYLEQRFGFWSYKTGAFFFLLSRTIGAAFRLFLVAMVLYDFFFDDLGMSFAFTVFISITMIWLYTFRGGIKTVIWTDTLQTFFMLAAVGTTIVIISQEMDLTLGGMASMVYESDLSKTFFWDGSTLNFFKQFFGGMFIAIVMTGLDQDMMQKNLTCRNLKDAQKNMYTFSIVLIFVNILFLAMGALLYMYAEQQGIEIPMNAETGKFLGDKIYPMIANGHLGNFAGIIFLLGVIAAAYSSADSALTSLTTSFCIDFLDFNKSKTGEAKKRMRRIQVHLVFSIILFVVILIFKALKNDSVINEVFKVATYTYGPLLGLYAFGLFTKINVKDKFVPLVCAISPVLSFFLNHFSKEWFNGYVFGFELIILNGLITFIGLLLLYKKGENADLVKG
ncbi:MAG: SSS family transporter [Flammeovirgaceae bacterium]|jgi:SSS family transporter